MKLHLSVGAAAFVAMGVVGCNGDASLGSGSGSQAEQSVDAAGEDSPSGVKCLASEHECTCASGSYCAPFGAMCIAPTAACPGQADAGSADASVTCGSNEHACTCAGGSYCAPFGAMCIAPTAACPGQADAGADGGVTCGSGEHKCACATGSYCLQMGAACLSPTSPCP